MTNRYEVHLSDTARADLSQLEGLADASSEAQAKLQRVRTLLDQVVQGDSADSDQVLLSGAVALELRYRSDGGTYLYFRRDQDAKIVVVAFFCDLDPPKAGPIARAPTNSDHETRIVDLQLRDIPQGMEVETAIERSRPDGTKNLVRVFTRKVDWGDFYTVLTHSGSNGQGQGTVIVSGKKGEVEGDWRRDLVEMTELLPDGGVRRHAAQTVPVWLGNAFYESHSTEELRARMRKFFASIPEDSPWRAELKQRWPHFEGL